MSLAAAIAEPAHAGLDDAAIAAAINAATVPVAAPIRAEDVQRYLMVAGKWPRLVALARGLIAGSEEHVLAALALIEALEKLQSFDFTVPAYKDACQANLAACVAAGLIDQTHRDAIESMQTRAVPRWQALGFSRPLDHGDIKTARQA